MVTKRLQILVLVVCLFISFSCATKKKVVEDDFGVEDETGTELTLDDAAENVTAPKDEFAEFDNPEQAQSQEPPPAEPESTPPPEETAAQPTEVPPQETAPPEPVIAEPVATPTAKISDVKFLANDNGGTFVISADYPLQFNTRMNSNTNQLIVEVQNAIIPDSLKRPLNTKDMTSTIGSVDIYQNANSNIARFVVQLRPGTVEPLVQPEGNSLLVIGAPSAEKEQQKVVESAPAPESEPVEESELGIMGTESIEDFLANNNKFYGRKISIETTDMDVRDVLKFISEESGVNMIFDDGIQGKVSLKLRKVPWDQALVTILKSKKMAYRRQGQVLRIGLADELAKEEANAINLREAKSKFEPLIVKNFAINYADVTSLEAKIRDFISESGSPGSSAPGGDDGAPSVSGGDSGGGRGKVTTDARTNTLIVTETATKLSQVEKLIQLLDTQPQQVLIEGRVVEASETYARAVGVNFGFNLPQTGDANLIIPGRDRFVTGSSSNFYSPSATFNPTMSGAFNGSLWLGQFGAFGDLSTRLALDEQEEKVKILSSPRIAVLHNTEATITQGSVLRVPDTTTQSAGTATSTQTFKDVEVGVNLTVTPLISSIGTVNLKLAIERSAATGSSGNRTSRTIKTNIIVKSGETAVIGGVFTSDVTTARQGIPGLKDLPILGTLFRTSSNSNQKAELMFFISPRILKTLEAPFFKASQDLEEQPASE